MEILENDIEAILSGRQTNINSRLDFDFQSEISVDDLRYFPITKINVCYIVCCVLFNEEGLVLLVQEAKKNCYGQWYLPAGRMEPNETILDGAKRELKEEAGLECDLNTLLCVEINHTWIRFCFTGKITGGKLKTTAEKDSESLQAQYFHVDNLPKDIRCPDILKLIQLGQAYHKALEPSARHPDCLPVIHPHKYLSHRIIILDQIPTSDEPMHVLASVDSGTDPHIPCIFGSVIRSSHIHAQVALLLHAACSIQPFESSAHVHGILGVEHRGIQEQEDGMCITYLVSLDHRAASKRPAVTSEKYFWHPFHKKTLQERLIAAASGQIIPLLKI